jgi:hypothetical protein
MELNLLSRHPVRFRGPALDRPTRAALSAAAVSIIERRQRDDWGGQLQDFVASVEARDDGDAVRRVAAALERHRAFGDFAAAPASR